MTRTKKILKNPFFLFLINHESLFIFDGNISSFTKDCFQMESDCRSLSEYPKPKVSYYLLMKHLTGIACIHLLIILQNFSIKE